ncbi:hypothetical protein [Phyllobacterium endophyticum]|uniref:hypothetical protein n=1 Tax=Phyllobacterium endophyticum TaxID=1149773 RepID=UPI001474D9ED|nr:hypothetical protein [Phyllobacterium endophyticum]MBB3235303.1 hypothetical protein [Phyllobacterium endophyticum]
MRATDGFDINVAGKTKLTGGLITSKAPKEANLLQTGTLETADIDTHFHMERR